VRSQRKTNLKTQYRRQNGKKLEGDALARKIAQDISGMMLYMAFMKVKMAGLKLRVHKLDGQISHPVKEQDMTRLNVEVTDGVIRKAWAG
jgi:hypothetical protein